MNRHDKSKPPRPGMTWSEKYHMWVDPDTRTAERRSKDEAIARSVEADQERLKEVLRQAEAIQGRQADALEKVAESLALTVLRELMEARRKAGLTQTEVARRMNVPQSAVVRLESGAHSPTLSTLSRYAAAIGVTLQVKRIA
jgi:ribosome-binding protein aMBF1 (putative translation factor)